MQTPDVVLSRIDNLNEGLSQAVQKTGGAQFAMMLSMIWDSQSQALGLDVESAANGSDTLPKRDDLYTPELVARLNQSFRSGNMGDVHLLLSWLDTAPLRLVVKPAETGVNEVALSQAAVMAKQYTVLDEVKDSQYRIAA